MASKPISALMKKLGVNYGPCATEDSDNCYWDGGANGKGTPFVAHQGKVHYVQQPYGSNPPSGNPGAKKNLDPRMPATSPK